MDTQSNIYIVGGTTGSLPGNTNSGGAGDGFIAKYDTSGNLLFVTQLGNSGQTYTFSSVAVDPSGDLYVGGLFSSNYAVGKFDSTGQLINVIPTSLLGVSVGTDLTGNLYIVGSNTSISPVANRRYKSR